MSVRRLRHSSGADCSRDGRKTGPRARRATLPEPQLRRPAAAARSPRPLPSSQLLLLGPAWTAPEPEKRPTLLLHSPAGNKAGTEERDRRRDDSPVRAARKTCDWLMEGASDVCAVRSTWSRAPPRRPQQVPFWDRRPGTQSSVRRGRPTEPGGRGDNAAGHLFVSTGQKPEVTISSGHP